MNAREQVNNTRCFPLLSVVICLRDKDTYLNPPPGARSKVYNFEFVCREFKGFLANKFIRPHVDVAKGSS